MAFRHNCYFSERFIVFNIFININFLFFQKYLITYRDGFSVLKKEFMKRNNKLIKLMLKDKDFRKQTQDWFKTSLKYEYSYHFTWLGRPIIQYPQDILAVQEIIWKIKPDLIIETGIAHGGSLILSASILELIGNGKVLGIDIDIRKHNKNEIEMNSMFKRITMIEGSSIDRNVIKKVQRFARGMKKIMVILDSNHTHKHVLKELKAYSPLVSKGSYLIVFDTIIENMPEEYIKNRPWGINNNPKTAVNEFLKTNERFKIDKKIEEKLLFTAAPSGYLKCTKNIEKISK